MTKVIAFFDLTIDVNILMVAFNLSDQPDRNKVSLSLIKKVESDESYGLALDKGGMIKHQYEEKLKNSSYTYWLQLLASKDKIRNVVPKYLNKGTQTKLKEAHFDKEDLKYVKTSAATECKILVSHDPDYSSNVRRILRSRLGVSVRKSEDCLDLK